VSASLTLQWNAADEDPSFSRNACVISHYDGTKWMKEGTVGAASGSNPYTRTASGVDSFSPFTVSSNLSVLPVTFIDFGATKEGQRIKLTWQASIDGSMPAFEVERSADGRTFSTLAKVSAQTSPGTHSYESFDLSPQKGWNYYRLKMVETNGAVQYSRISKITWGIRIPLAISPNPVSTELIVQWDKTPSAITVLDVSGRTVLQLQPNQTNRYSVRQLKAGTYFVRMQACNEVETVPVIVQ
jgi:hypothetical protein